ncbi:hypothetical protein [Calothrix sp. 336/3]|nr:hypothetical protein [Calothrix sp. 336/3]
MDSASGREGSMRISDRHRMIPTQDVGQIVDGCFCGNEAGS